MADKKKKSKREEIEELEDEEDDETLVDDELDENVEDELDDENEDESDEEDDDEEEAAPKKVKVSRPAAKTKQLHAAIQKARKEERKKLRSEIAGLEDKIRRVSKIQRADGELDVTALVTDAVKSARTELEDKHSKEMRRMKKELQRLLDQQKQQRLGEARNAAITKYKGRVIQQMIRGDSEEEIEASAEAAHEAWKTAFKDAGVAIEDDSDDDDDVDNEDEEDEDEYTDETVDEDEDDTESSDNFKQHARSGALSRIAPAVKTKKSKASAVPPLLPAASGSAKDGGRRGDPMTMLKKVKGMSPTEYREHRAGVKKKLKQMYS